MTTAVVIPQAQSVSQAVITASGAYTVGDTYGPFPVDFFYAAEVTLVVTVGSGTLNVFVQKLLPDNVLYDDIAAFAAVTTTGAATLSFINGGNFINAQKAAALTSSSTIPVAFGSYWRVQTVITGTSAAFNFGIFANFRARGD